MLPPKVEHFVNPRDAWCAWGIWWALLALYLVYAAFSTANLLEELKTCEKVETEEKIMPLPHPSFDVCETSSLSKELSLLPFVRVKLETGWFSKDGLEGWPDEPVASSEPYAFDDEFTCKRYTFVSRAPKAASVTYYTFFVGVQEPVPEQLYRIDGRYIAGLMFRPSLSANATNSFAMQEERMLRMYVPSWKVPGYRHVTLSATPALAKWQDTIGGRMGAPCEDTFYFADMKLVPGPLQLTSGNRTGNLTSNRYTLKMALDLPHRTVEVNTHVNDVVKSGLNWIGQLAAATAIFKLVATLFPSIEKDSLRLFMQLPWLGLGWKDSELDPLMP